MASASSLPRRPLRVVNVYSGNLFGGVESVLAALAWQRHLCPNLDWSFALCFEGRLSDELRAAGAPVHSLGTVRMSRPWTVVRARRRLDAFLKSQPFDVVINHSTWPHALAAPVVRRNRLPLAFWAHGPHGPRTWFDWWTSRYPPDLIIANSAMTLRDVEASLFRAPKSEIVYCPVPAPANRLADDVRRATRREFDVAEDGVVGMISCRLEPWKGHELLLEALGRIKDIPAWTWWVAGGAQRPEEEAYLARLRRRALELGIGERVRFLGQRTDIPRLLASADLHCQPNTGPEPFGIAFVEALYAGLPVVTTAMGGALEIVDETCGVLTPPGDADSLAKALARLVTDADRRGQLGRGGPARAFLLSDPAARLAQLERILSELSLSKNERHHPKAR